MNPIEQLESYLVAGTAPPFDWVVEFAPDGTLQQVWDDAESGPNLLGLYAFTSDDRGLACGIIACLRPTIRIVGRQYKTAFEAVDRFAKRKISREELGRVRDSEWIIRDTPLWRTLFATTRSDRSYAVHSVLIEAVDRAVTQQMSPREVDALYVRIIREQAETVRALLPCPTLEQVMPRE